MDKADRARPRKERSARAPRHKATAAEITQPFYQLRILLMGSKPAIWRRLLVPGSVRLSVLHAIIQEVMGWTNSHLHEFKMGDTSYSDPEFGLQEDDPDVQDEFKARLSEVAPKEGASFLYEYDFGDGWRHNILVERILPSVPKQRKIAVCLAGARACPPEDCGGIYGYMDFLEAIRDPSHERHEELLDWIGGDFDPEAFDVNLVNECLKGIK